MKRSFIILPLVWVFLTGSIPCFASTNILFILDSSNSMWGQVDKIAKIATAKKVLKALVSDLPEGTNVGLMAYGHNKERDCTDVSILSPIRKNNPDNLSVMIDAIQPKGKTPLTYALDQSLSAFSSLKGQNNYIVLISDGMETCGGDPCTASAKLVAAGINVRVNVVGFDVEKAERMQLECIASNGNGRYFNADNTKNLEAAFVEVKKAVVKAPTPAKIEGSVVNLLDPKNGGQTISASHDLFPRLIDGKEDTVQYFNTGQQAVYAFKDEQLATLESVAVPI
ncbi:MAG: VWA domain-containing protein, partial [Desulfobacteraceae bacterium]|nr:VWA domain-containing protein [Desulfobacteraceae bacterium]